jgi:DNA-binding GntR family transcriptional regulator
MTEAIPLTAIPSAPSASRTRRDRTNDEIYDKIYTSILEHRLMPGTKLAEERMAAIFKVSRARMREILGRLAYEQIVDVFPNRGAYVAKPSVDQAREVFEARQVIEPAIMRRLAAHADDEQADRLEAHVRHEFEARARDDKRAIIRLSGEFHNVAADLAGNGALARSLRELASLTCLIILLYDAPTAVSCRPDEHEAIAAAIRRRDGETAAAVMSQHLAAIEASVDLFGGSETVNLEEIFGSPDEL